MNQTKELIITLLENVHFEYSILMKQKLTIKDTYEIIITILCINENLHSEFCN